MKNNKLLFMVLISSFIFSFTGCKKDEEKAIDSAATLTSKTWTLSKMETASTIKGVIDEVQRESDMIKGASLSFKQDFTFIMIMAGMPLTGTWDLASDNKTLTMTTQGHDPDVSTISAISSSELVISETGEIVYEESPDNYVVENVPLTTTWR